VHVTPKPSALEEENAVLRSERDLAFRELVNLRTSFQELARQVAGQNDRLDHIASMLRRREAQLVRAEREIRRLRRKLGLDPDPEPEAEPVPEETAAAPGSGQDAPATGGPAEAKPSSRRSKGSSAPAARPGVMIQSRSHGSRRLPCGACCRAPPRVREDGVLQFVPAAALGVGT